jgi:hypothetical protein
MVVIISLLMALVILSRIEIESFIVLFGVIPGALISEISHQVSSSKDRNQQFRLEALDRRF